MTPFRRPTSLVALLVGVVLAACTPGNDCTQLDMTPFCRCYYRASSEPGRAALCFQDCGDLSAYPPDCPDTH